MSRADDIAELFPDENIWQMDGFDDAIIGYTEPLNQVPQLVYSVNKIMEILRGDGLDLDSAQEYFDFNIAQSYGPVVLVYTP